MGLRELTGNSAHQPHPAFVYRQLIAGRPGDCATPYILGGGGGQYVDGSTKRHQSQLHFNAVNSHDATCTHDDFVWPPQFAFSF